MAGVGGAAQHAACPVAGGVLLPAAAPPRPRARPIFGPVSDDQIRDGATTSARASAAGVASAAPVPADVREALAAAEAAIDAALVRRTQGGDREAFGQLVRRHLHAAHSAALAVLGDATDAEDVVQDAFLAALTRLEECRPAEKFRGWLLVIVRNRSIDVRRRQRVRATEPIEGADGIATASAGQPTALASRIPGPLEETERADARKHLEAALATLTDVRREVVLLHDLEGWSHREIAAHLGLAEGTVRAHLFWARRALRERLRAISKGD